MKLDNSIAAIVTGGASGLGGATVSALAAQLRVKIAIFDLEPQQAKADALLQEIGGGAFCPCDVTSEAQVDAAANT